MSKTINLDLTEDEVRELLSVLQGDISRELEVLQDNDYDPASETFVVFIESVQRKTDIYIKLNSSVEENSEEQ